MRFSLKYVCKFYHNLYLLFRSWLNHFIEELTNANAFRNNLVGCTINMAAIFLKVTLAAVSLLYIIKNLSKGWQFRFLPLYVLKYNRTIFSLDMNIDVKSQYKAQGQKTIVGLWGKLSVKWDYFLKLNICSVLTKAVKPFIIMLKMIVRMCMKEYYNFYFVARLWNIYENIFLAALKLALGVLGWFFWLC